MEPMTIAIDLATRVFQIHYVMGGDHIRVMSLSHTRCKSGFERVTTRLSV